MKYEALLMTRMKRGIESVVLEYDADGGRKQSKVLTDGQARRMYMKLSMEGKNPKIVKAVR